MTTPASKRSESEAFSAIPHLFAFNGEIPNVLSSVGQAYADACMQWSKEIMDFVQARLEEDRKLQKTIADGPNWVDAIDAQQKWAKTAAQAHLSEFQRLREISMKTTATMMSAWQPAEKHPSTHLRHAAE